MKDQPTNVFFPGLNSLRAIAAYCVLFQHSNQFLTLFGYDSSYGVKFTRFLLTGRQSVLLFFVLSGFLITFFLLKEFNSTKKINIKLFYKKRASRVVPLYFLILFISLLLYLKYPLLPPDHPVKVFLLDLFLLPNIALINLAPFFGTGHLWSLGEENQFYLLWPLLIRFCRNIFQAILLVLLIKTLLGLFLYFFHTNLVISFLFVSSSDSFIVGGIIAWAVFKQHKPILSFCFHPIMQSIAYLGIICCIYYQDQLIFISASPSLNIITTTFFISLLFGILIVNVSCNPHSFLKLENYYFNYLGKISYGIYMFHPLILIFLMLIFTKVFFIPKGVGLVYLTYFSTVILTTGIAALSFHYFENPWMQYRRKENFSVLPKADPFNLKI